MSLKSYSQRLTATVLSLSLLFFLGCKSQTSAPVSLTSEPAVKPMNIILDSDFGSSTDDLFALMMLHHYIDEGRVNLNGIIVDREGEKNAQLVDVFNTYYGHPDIPVGIERNGVKNPRCFIPYSGIVDLQASDGTPLFRHSLDASKLPDGKDLYRRLLSRADDKSVVIVAIGFVTTLSQLFESQADDYSPLNGVDLFSQKVKAVYIQSGRFESGDSLSGYNMRAASRQSAIFYERFPKNVDLIMSPSNVGDMMNYPPKDVLVDLSSTMYNPIKSVYVNYTCETGQRMWDTNCLVNAVLGDSEYNLSPRGWVTFVDKGEQSLMLFREDPNGNARYQLPGDTYFAEAKLMDIRRHNRQNAVSAEFTIEPPQPQIIGHDAALWTGQRLVQLADKYMGSAGNTLDPDEVRALFRPLGYVGLNWKDYSEAEKLLVDTIFSCMIQKALRAGKTDLVIVTGPPASGKTTAVKTLKFKGAGLIFDAALTRPHELESVVAKAKRMGMTKITLVPVYNDVLTCYKNSINRGQRTWRFTALDDMIEAFTSNHGRLAELISLFPDIDVLPVNCGGNSGVNRVTVEQALQWDYQISDEQMRSLLTCLLDQLNEGNIEAVSAPAAAGDVLAIPNLSDSNRTIAEQIHRKLQEMAEEYKQRN